MTDSQHPTDWAEIYERQGRRSLAAYVRDPAYPDITGDTGRVHGPELNPNPQRTYRMRRFTIVAPHVDNAGQSSGYPAALRAALLAHGIDGWTETETHGSWRGTREAGVTFEILREVANTRLVYHAPDDVLVNLRPPQLCATTVAAAAAYRGVQTVNGFLAELATIGRDVMPDQEAIQVTVDVAPAIVHEG